MAVIHIVNVWVRFKAHYNGRLMVDALDEKTNWFYLQKWENINWTSIEVCAIVFEWLLFDPLTQGCFFNQKKKIAWMYVIKSIQHFCVQFRLYFVSSNKWISVICYACYGTQTLVNNLILYMRCMVSSSNWENIKHHRPTKASTIFLRVHRK